MGNRPGAPPGNQNALKHGYYSKYFKRLEKSDLKKIDVIGLESEIALMRVLLRRIFELTNNEDKPEVLIEYVKGFGLFTQQLAHLIKVQYMIGSTGDNFGQTLSLAIGDALEFLKDDND